MKRKRGSKKGKSKKTPPVVTNEASLDVVTLDTQDNSGLDDSDNAGNDSVMDTDTPSSTGTDQQEIVANLKPEVPAEKKMVQSVYGRVKVKLKNSKLLDSQPSSLDVPMQSDTEKSSQKIGLEKHITYFRKKEDHGNNSLPESKIAALGNSPKKSGSIKFKTSMGLGSLSVDNISNTVLKIPPPKNPIHNKKELDDSLKVIKKVMKMDAAEPFNSPVNPTALGIPDYFDVIKTPMDFGTICSNLEKGVKYTSSEGVFKDVQHIWGNCYKYNNKGDYIVDLMKRVKKNFAKYWTAAGLYNEPTINGEADDAEHVHLKGGQMKQKKGKRHGFKKHKDGCLCAVCILMRRRREREEHAKAIEMQANPSQNNQDPKLKQEKTSPVESPSGEDTSSNMENSLDPESEDELDDKGEEQKSEPSSNHKYSSPQVEKQEDKANETGIVMVSEEETPEKSQHGDQSLEGPRRQWSGGVQTDNEKEESPVLDKVETDEIQEPESKESQEAKKAKLFENLERFENPMFLRLCDTIFPDDDQTVWSGPHSLVRRKSSARNNPIHAAIQTFLKRT